MSSGFGVERVGEVYGWFAVFYLLGALAAALLVLVAVLLTAKDRGRRSELVASSIATSFGCVAYAVVVMSFWVLLRSSGSAFEPASGDESLCQLPNGYVLSMSQDWSHGYITKGMSRQADASGSHRYAVTRIQVSGDLVLGWSELTESPNMHYFILDTRTGNVEEFGKFLGLRDAAAKRGVAVKLQSPHAYVRKNNRYGLPWWLYCLLLGPVIVVLGEWVWRMGVASRPIPIRVA